MVKREVQAGHVVAASALAYYTIFALTPGLVLVIAVAGFLLGQDAEGQRFLGRSACSLASRRGRDRGDNSERAH